jgi:hypothetical protein
VRFSLRSRIPVKWVPCHSDMACRQVAYGGGDGLQTRRVAENILNMFASTGQVAAPPAALSDSLRMNSSQ